MYSRSHSFDMDKEVKVFKEERNCTKAGRTSTWRAGVRQYHARGDSGIFAHHRLGLLKLPE